MLATKALQKCSKPLQVILLFALSVLLPSVFQADSQTECVEGRDGSFQCAKPGVYTWKRPRGVRWVSVQGVGGGGGGASGAIGMDHSKCTPGGGGGAGASIV